MCIFLEKINIFRNLKLEIALAIPASNDEKYNKNNLAVQWLNKLNVDSSSLPVIQLLFK